MKETFAATGKRLMNKVEIHDCRKFLVPYLILRTKGVEIIKKRASCSKCQKTYTLTYLLTKIEGYNG